VPGDGHPTPGTAYVIACEIDAEPIERITFNLTAERTSVNFGDVYWKRQPYRSFGPTFTSGGLSRVLKLEDVDLNARFPLQ
jgi:hypothetical protein